MISWAEALKKALNDIERRQSPAEQRRRKRLWTGFPTIDAVTCIDTWWGITITGTARLPICGQIVRNWTQSKIHYCGDLEELQKINGWLVATEPTEEDDVLIMNLGTREPEAGELRELRKSCFDNRVLVLLGDNAITDADFVETTGVTVVFDYAEDKETVRWRMEYIRNDWLWEGELKLMPSPTGTRWEEIESASKKTGQFSAT